MKVSGVSPQSGRVFSANNLKSKPRQVTFAGNEEKPNVEPEKKGIMDLLSEHKGKIGIGVGVAALLAGIGYFAMRKDSPQAKPEVASNADGDTFKSQAIVKKNNNPQITGASNKRNWEKTEIA